ncbi:leukocyte elastase inhibitor-like [Paramacrobiotus metropolitanus]|uniref:leukocyte elastase inhibitor-like n=1 Tax=Paramacrobiotus metropolitanus TaxID=2943436 RepID=UPI0024464D68|nr:leukocyte elastase inhibitor-like [Paramacrobiotus metropolitanus]XP_055351923.1 leukocyte elastase inhibitor-like [Paramacrobiotus metropolitanus]XP_055351924.1 leukocyte elastase inhibitor-like [Paramacrobiotus metropolitanus]XP_055351925.1 leukocyte elastase inhibitor-like [Paramacrobiotus metropolitanus]
MDPLPPSFSDRCLDFCMKFYNHIADRGCYSSAAGNLLFSPLCAEVALSMACLGARGITREEILSVLERQKGSALDATHQTLMHLKQNEELLRSDYIRPAVNYKLFLSSGLFVAEQYPIKECFVDEAKRLFDAVCRSVQFAEHPDEAALVINGFVNEQTCGTIDNLIAAADFSRFTRMVSVNALYFKANWHHQFLEENTTKKPFMTARGDTVMVETMHATMPCQYYKSKELNGAKFLQVPYVEECCHAYFILPGKKKRFSRGSSSSSLTNLQRSLTPAKLQNAMQSLRPVWYGTIQLPKFCIQEGVNMESMLQDLGMTAAFEKDLADFTGISDSNLYISKTMQKSYINVNEKGTEASAAVQMTFVDACLPPDTKCKFIADRPFMFMIRHEASDAVLFIGHVADPSDYKS